MARGRGTGERTTEEEEGGRGGEGRGRKPRKGCRGQSQAAASEGEGEGGHMMSGDAYVPAVGRLRAGEGFLVEAKGGLVFDERPGRIYVPWKH